MDIIPPIQRPADPAAVAADRAIATINQQFDQIVRTHATLYETMWRSFAFTPDEFAAALGDRGAAFAQAAHASSQFIAGLCAAFGLELDEVLPPSDRVPPRELIAHEDGTLTLGE